MSAAFPYPAPPLGACNFSFNFKLVAFKYYLKSVCMRACMRTCVYVCTRAYANDSMIQALVNPMDTRHLCAQSHRQNTFKGTHSYLAPGHARAHSQTPQHNTRTLALDLFQSVGVARLMRGAGRHEVVNGLNSQTHTHTHVV